MVRRGGITPLLPLVNPLMHPLSGKGSGPADVKGPVNVNAFLTRLTAEIHLAGPAPNARGNAGRQQRAPYQTKPCTALHCSAHLLPWCTCPPHACMRHRR